MKAHIATARPVLAGLAFGALFATYMGATHELLGSTNIRFSELRPSQRILLFGCILAIVPLARSMASMLDGGSREPRPGAKRPSGTLALLTMGFAAVISACRNQAMMVGAVVMGASLSFLLMSALNEQQKVSSLSKDAIPYAAAYRDYTAEVSHWRSTYYWTQSDYIAFKEHAQPVLRDCLPHGTNRIVVLRGNRDIDIEPPILQERDSVAAKACLSMLTRWTILRNDIGLVYRPEAGDDSRIQASFTRLAHANLIGADLHGAELDRADLGGANLEDANLRGADLSHAHLAGANLKGADLRRTTMFGTNLYNATLSEANLGGASLLVTNFARAKLDGANLDQVYWEEEFTPVELTLSESHSVFFKSAIFESAFYSQTTRFPKDFDPRTQRMVCTDCIDQRTAPISTKPVHPQPR